MKPTVVLFVMALIALTACGNDAAEPETVKIAYLPVVHGLPFYLALEKGYFASEGITVEAVKFDSPNLLIQALVSGQVDFGATSAAAGITAVADHAKPGTLKIWALAGSAYAGTTGVAMNEGIIIGKDSGIQTIADLRGKKLGILPSIQWRTIARHIMAQNGLSIDTDLTIVELAPGLQAQALAAGQVDALLAIEPVLTIARLQGISRSLTEAPVETYVADPLYAGAGVLRSDFAQQHPETTRKVLAVFAKSIAEINQDPDAARQYYNGYTALDDRLIAEVPPVVYKMYTDFTPKDVAAAQQFFDIFATYGVIASRVNATSLIYAG